MGQRTKETGDIAIAGSNCVLVFNKEILTGLF